MNSWWWSQREKEKGMGVRGHTGKGVLLGNEEGDKGILLFLDWAIHNLLKKFTNECEVLLHGELWWGGHSEI